MDRPNGVSTNPSKAQLTGTAGGSGAPRKPLPKLTDAEIESAKQKIAGHIDLPASESVKEAFACSSKGFRSGSLFLTQSYVVFVGKKATFGESAKCWYWYDILDLYIKDEKLCIVDANPKVACFKNFPDGVDRVYKAIKRGVFGLDENTVLHQAVDSGDYEKVKACLERDVSLLSKVNRDEQTPLIKACLKNDLKMTKTLLEYYKKAPGIVDINQKTGRGQDHLLHAICRSTDPIEDNILTTILEFEGIDAGCKNAFDETTPLHYFAQHNRSLQCQAIGKLFLKAGAEFNACTKFNETPLHKAIFNQRVRVLMVGMLLDHNANPTAKGGKRDDTPLHYAIRLQRRDLVLLLLSKGGDISVCNSEGFDCVQTAKSECEYSPGTHTAEILLLLEQVADLITFLKKVDLETLTPKFIENGLQDPDLLCEMTEEDINSLKFDIKVGPRLKLTKEIAELKSSRAEAKKKQEQAKIAEEQEKQKAEVNAVLSGKSQHGLNTADIRQKLSSAHGNSNSRGWEISAEELEFTAKLGQGASGQVFKGLYRGNEVAIKVLTATNVEQELLEFQKEFQILTGLDSPYMITFYGAVVENYLMMVMELCDRGSLYDVLTKTPKELSWQRAVNFASDMAEGIAVLHNHVPPIIHRDLKSLNLLVTKNWKCKVCDFGLSRLVQGDMKTFGRLCGTFAYASPEVFGGGKATEKSDVFSMGIVLWELLNTAATGKYDQPYAEYHFTMDFQIIVQTAQGLRPSVPAGSQVEFVSLFKECVEGDPEVRPTAAEAAQTIRKWKRAIETPAGYEHYKQNLTKEFASGGQTPAQAAPVENKPTAKFSGWGKPK